jgi:hypothetical protein
MGGIAKGDMEAARDSKTKPLLQITLQNASLNCVAIQIDHIYIYE